MGLKYKLYSYMDPLGKSCYRVSEVLASRASLNYPALCKQGKPRKTPPFKAPYVAYIYIYMHIYIYIRVGGSQN